MGCKRRVSLDCFEVVASSVSSFKPCRFDLLSGGLKPFVLAAREEARDLESQLAIGRPTNQRVGSESRLMLIHLGEKVPVLSIDFGRVQYKLGW